MTIRGISHTILAVAFAVLLATCGADRLVGGASEAEGMTIAGTLIDARQKPVVNAQVVLHQAREVTVPSQRSSVIDSTRTDRHGAFRFGDVPHGDYQVAARSMDGASSALAPVAMVDTQGVILPALTMKGTATITGAPGCVSPTTGFDAFVSVHNTPYGAPVRSDGSFSLDGVAVDSGTLLLVVADRQDPSRQVVAAQLTLRPQAGHPIVLDSLPLNRLEQSGPSVTEEFDHCTRTSMFDSNAIWWRLVDVNGTEVFPPDNNSDDLMDSPGYGENGCAAHITFTMGPDTAYEKWYPYCGIGTEFLGKVGSIPVSIDLSSVAAISYRVKGTAPGATLRVRAVSHLEVVSNFVGHELDSIPAEWTQYTIDFTDDVFNADYDKSHRFHWQNLRQFATKITFQVVGRKPGIRGELWIDDVRIVFQ
jgi:hypothetical protein